MKKNKLIRRLLVIFVSMALVMIIAISILIYINNAAEVIAQYSELAISYAKAGAAYIDGDCIAEYTASGVTDDYYEDVLRFLDLELENSDLMYYYVIVPGEDDYTYVWSASIEETEPMLGVHMDYDEYAEDTMKAAFSRDPDIWVSSGDTDLYGSLVSVFYPIFDSQGDPAALVGVDLSLPDLSRSINRLLLIAVISMTPVILIVIGVVFWYLRRRVVKPILAVNAAAGEMVEDIDERKDIVIPVTTRDEIEDLAHSLEKMYRELRQYIDELYKATADRERVDAELAIAARIQADLLPNVFPPFPDRDEFDLSAAMLPAKEVGGDFYDFFMIDDDHLALLIADVSDKGVPAAMFMVVAKTLIKNVILSGLSPKDALYEVNNQLCESTNTGMFVTMWLGILTISDGMMICANAGHEYPAIGRKNGGFTLFYDNHGFVLAGMKDMKYQEYEISLDVGDTLFVYTDGVAEAINADNEQFGTDRIIAALNSETPASCREEITRVFTAIERFEGDAPQYDDITMLCLRIRKKEKSMETSGVTLDGQPVLTEFAENTFASWQVPQNMIMEMNIALDEIYSNIVNYSGADHVKMTCGISEEEITLAFEDNGVFFDPTAAGDVDITQTAEERKIGGLGIYIVKNSMDRMDYRYADGKNMLTLGMREI